MKKALITGMTGQDGAYLAELLISKGYEDPKYFRPTEVELLIGDATKARTKLRWAPKYDLDALVKAALIRKFYEAKNSKASFVEVWGTGTPRREFLHVDDLADACFFLMKNYSEAEFINVGTREDITIIELALMIKK
jgi:nucleoside-diphosphate-sugar epimerase